MAKPLVIALSKGRLLDLSIDFFKKMGIDSDNLGLASRRLMFDIPNRALKILLVRAVDVPTYVEYGAADMGIAGKDLLLEHMCDVYEPIDLCFGHCRIVLAEADNTIDGIKRMETPKRRIATKYPNITERYFSEKGVPIEIIKLYGSIELAPLVGLADQIVDLSSSGATMEANNLTIVDEIADCTARVIVNRASLKLKYPAVRDFINEVKAVLHQDQRTIGETSCP